MTVCYNGESKMIWGACFKYKWLMFHRRYKQKIITFVRLNFLWGRNVSKTSTLGMNSSVITKVSELLCLVQIGLWQNFWASKFQSVTVNGNLLL